MEYLILGLLLLSPMTGYELQQFIRQNLSLICSHSAGSVQTALAKLEREGAVLPRASTEGRRRKKTFFITEQGRTTFLRWIAQPMQAGRVKNMELSKLFFLGLARPDERVAAIKDYINQLEQTKGVLCAIRLRFEEVRRFAPEDGQDWEDIFRFQGYTIDYGIAAADFEMGWYANLLKKMEDSI